MTRIVRVKPVRKPMLRRFKLVEGLPKYTELLTEIADMRDVLMGRAEPPVGGVLALQEVADAYFARCSEVESLIFTALREGNIIPNCPLDDVRKKELRSFKELCKSATELGSRRLTAESLRFEQERKGRETG